MRCAMCKSVSSFALFSQMSVYVDNERIPWRGREWCHLVADSLDELHAFAAKLGLRRAWFQERASYPHYDVTVSVRNLALALGALNADRAMLIACCKKLRAEMAAGRRPAQNAVQSLTAA